MNCDRSEELFRDYLDGTLAPPLQRALEQHLGECSGCNGLLDAFRLVVVTLDRHPRVHPGEALVSRIMTATRPRMQKRKRAGRRARSEMSGVQWLGWAAAATVVIGLMALPARPWSTIGVRVSQFAHQAYSSGLRIYHDAEAIADQLKGLGMTVEVGFEARRDQINRRLQDFGGTEGRADGGETPTESRHHAPDVGSHT